MKSNAGIWAGLFFLLFGAIIFWQSLSFDYYTNLGPGPGLLPLWLSVGMIVLSVLYIAESLKKSVVTFADILPKDGGFRNVLLVPVSLLVFMLTANITGFVVAGTLSLSILLVRGYKWYWGIGISAGFSILLFLIFQTLLDIPLPVNAWGW